MEAWQSGGAQPRAEHWGQGQCARRLLRLRLHRGKRRRVRLGRMQRRGRRAGRRGRRGVAHHQPPRAHGGAVGGQVQRQEAQQVGEVHVSSTQRLGDDRGALGQERVTQLLAQPRRRLLFRGSFGSGVGLRQGAQPALQIHEETLHLHLQRLVQQV